MAQVSILGVSFGQGDTDTPFPPIVFPPGYTRWSPVRATLYHASASLSGSTAGIFTGANGSGSTIAYNQNAAVSSSIEHTVGNAQLLGLLNASEVFNQPTLFFRVGNPTAAPQIASSPGRVGPAVKVIFGCGFQPWLSVLGNPPSLREARSKRTPTHLRRHHDA